MLLKTLATMQEAAHNRRMFDGLDTSCDEALTEACDLLVAEYRRTGNIRTLCNAVWMWDIAAQRGCEDLDTGQTDDRLVSAISIIVRG